MDEDNVITKEERVEAASSLSRRERRQLEKQQAADAVLEQKRLTASVKNLKENLTSLLAIYSNGYDEYIRENPDNPKGLVALHVKMEMNPTLVPLQELLESSSQAQADMEELKKCESKKSPGNIHVMYLRADLVAIRKNNPELSARPGVPEEVYPLPEGNIGHRQLFYHAIYAIPEDAEKVKYAAAEEKLYGDFMVHIFCKGLDSQQASNNKLWQRQLDAQSTEIKKRVDEVTEIFMHAGGKENKENKEGKE